jgi:2,5-diketo-D-gluconate reductase A
MPIVNPTASNTEFTLSTGGTIPAIGLGTWPLDDAQITVTAADAIKIGYRLIDTAAKYGNEAGVGQGIANADVPRAQLFVTTKLDGGYQGGDRAAAGLDASLDRLGLDYVDLLLIHWPLPARDLYVDTWRTFIRLQESGKAKAIGVSNFKPAHIDRLIGETGIVPAVNQIELDPTLARTETRKYNSANGILTQAWSPLGRGEALTNPVIGKIAARVGKSAAQVVLRWHLQLGISAVPKSASPTRLAENFDVFDFTLTPDDLDAIGELDRGESAAQDSDVIGH